MFDDLNQNNNTQQPNISNEDTARDKIDSLDFLKDSPTVNYQDKLKNNSFVRDNQPSNSAMAEDMFADTEKTKINTRTAVVPPKTSTGPAPLNPITDYSELVSEVEHSDSGKVKPVFFIIGLVVLLGILGTGGYWVYLNYFKNTNQVKEANLNNEAENIDLTNKNNDNQNGMTTNASVIKEDTDGDGLKDKDELTIGTNINKADTDDDGLADRAEVVVYNTDPLNPDTDGDGYKDGEEVNKGYNPLGPGRLLNLDMITSQNDNTESTEPQDRKLLPTNINMNSWETYSDKTLNISFKYPPSWNIVKKNNVVTLSGLEGDIVSLEIRENKLELDLIDWIAIQSDFPDFKQQEIIVNGVESLALSSTDFNWSATQSIFIPGPKKVFCFNYLNKKVNDGEFKEFQEIVMSFSYL